MKPLQIFYPFKPYNITQHWGVQNDSYKPLGFDHHNGVDANVGGNPASNWPVYCPVEGFTVALVNYQPNGGGNCIWLISDEIQQLGDKQCKAYLVLCHAAKILVQPGYKPALGELIMIADNTGFSTGPHTHMGLYRVDYDGKMFTFLDQNDMTGSYSPEGFFTGAYAIDQATLSTLITSNMRYYRYLIGG